MTPVEEVLKHVTLPFDGELHDYQVEDINNLALVENSGMWNSPGLGKTICSSLIAVYKLLHGYHTCYVLCPASLVTQWKSTLDKMGVKVAAYVGTPAARKKINRDVDFLVLSYQMFQKDYDILWREGVFFIVDEATLLCQPENTLYKQLQGGSVKKVLPPLPGKLKPEVEVRTFERMNFGCCLLTGTPVNKPCDAFGLISIKTPGVYSNFNQFKRIHVSQEDNFNQPIEYSELELLNSNLMLNAVRRLATDHLELPPINFKVVWWELEPAHKKVYDRLIEERMIEVDGNIKIDALKAMSLYFWTQRLILNPEHAEYTKDPAVFELMDIVINQVHNFIIFNNFVMSNEKLMKRYNIGGIFGGVTKGKKDAYLEDFVSGKLRGLVINPRAGGYGLDLPMCQNALIAEIPITPRDFLQCCARIHRQGQKLPVFITVFVAKGTIQETLYNRILKKDDLMRRVVSTESSLRKDLIMEVVDNKNLETTKEQLMMDFRGEGK